MALDPSQIASIYVPQQAQNLQLGNQKLMQGQQDLQLGDQNLQLGKQKITSGSLQQATDKLDYSLKTLAQVHDQASHEAWLNNMKSNGIDTTGDPTTYDPAWQQQSLVAGVSMKDQMQASAMANWRNNQNLNAQDRNNKGMPGWNPETRQWDDQNGPSRADVPMLGGGISPISAAVPNQPTSPPRGSLTASEAGIPTPPQEANVTTNGSVGGMPLSGAANTQLASAVNAQDPVAASNAAIAAQQKITGVSPAQRPDLANMPAGQVAAMPVSQTGATQPPVQGRYETPQQFSIRTRAYIAQQALAQRSNISNQQLSLGQQRLSETTRHDLATDAGGNALPQVDPNLTGDDLLKALPQNIAATVKGLADGSIKMPAPNMRSPAALKQWSDLMGLVKQYDPTAEASRQGNVAKAEMGPFANQIRSFSVSISHLDTLGTLVDALNNGDTNAINSASNSLSKQFGDPAVTNFNTAKQIVADEVMKAVIGAGGGQGDREKAQDVLSAANSPAQLKGVIQTYKTLMQGQLGGYRQQYQSATGRNDFNTRLSPEAQQEVGGQPKGGQPSATKVLNGVVYHNINGQWMQ